MTFQEMLKKWKLNRKQYEAFIDIMIKRNRCDFDENDPYDAEILSHVVTLVKKGYLTESENGHFYSTDSGMEVWNWEEPA